MGMNERVYVCVCVCDESVMPSDVMKGSLAIDSVDSTVCRNRIVIIDKTGASSFSTVPTHLVDARSN